MTIEDKIRQIAEAEEVDFLGVADLTTARAEIARQGGERVASYPRAVSIGVRLSDEIVDQLPWSGERAVAVSYRHHCYDVINDRLDLVASRMASALQREGYRAYPVPAAERYDDERVCAVFSHKLAAHLAGLGWIGKSCLLITPEHGPRARFITVLTDAPLEAGKPLDEMCGECAECVDACPVAAFTGRNFREAEPREARFDVRKCEGHYDKLQAEGRLRVCGMCLYACPHGRK